MLTFLITVLSLISPTTDLEIPPPQNPSIVIEDTIGY